MLKSKSDVKLPLEFEKFVLLDNSFNKSGGCSFKKFILPDGRLPSIECKNYIVSLIDQIKIYNKNAEIAVLAFNKDSIRSLQKDIYANCQNTDNLLVETIDRIQGLTTDFCIFFIPNESVPFALNPNRFNVATSRARLCTLMIGDSNISEFYPHIDENVRKYLEQIRVVDNTEEKKKQEFGFGDKLQNQDGKISLNIIDKIDLTKFEKPKKEISKEKENIYIIDTNVFVDYPDIITKIDQKFKIVLSAKVIDELDFLKISLTDEQRKNVQKALRNINENISKRNINMETADLSLLPADFNKKSPDNFILSVALKYTQENPIMLTSDNGLQIKAKGLKITTITLKEFLKQLKY
jgi:DNA replication ATP-dependent helicase Dna2